MMKTDVSSGLPNVAPTQKNWGSPTVWHPHEIITGWWLGTMEFYDFPETVGNGIIIPTDELSMIFRG